VRRRLALVALVGVVGLFVPARSVSSATRAIVIVMPHKGHIGDALYLSGAGFPPERELEVEYVCGSRFAGTDAGPRADSHGQFVAYSRLRIRKAKPGNCSIHVDAGSARGAAASARYTVLAPTQRLSRCDLQMCLQIKAALVRVSAGVQANLTIQGWPGALTDLTITDPGSKAQRGHVRLNWEGNATARMLVSFGLHKGLKGRVYAHARLGSISGSTSAPFILIPGGR